MSGHGGYKHRRGATQRKRSQKEQKARANIEKVRGIFESRGETWAPLDNPSQLAALSHLGRRLVERQAKQRF